MFGKISQEKSVFESSTFKETLGRTQYLIENGLPFGVIHGDRGLGKTTALRAAAIEATRAGNSVILLNVAALDTSAILLHLCGALSIPSASDTHKVETGRMMVQIREEILGRTSYARNVVILLDDLYLALGSPEPTIRFLAGLTQLSGGRVTTIATSRAGEIPSADEASELKLQLEPMTTAEASEFAIDLLESSHVDTNRVDEDAVRSLVEYANGVPARLVRACDVVRVALVAERSLRITEEIVHELTQETFLADVA